MPGAKTRCGGRAGGRPRSGPTPPSDDRARAPEARPAGRVPAAAEGVGDAVEGEVAAGGQGVAVAHGRIAAKVCLEGRRAAGVTRYRYPPSLGLEAVTGSGNGSCRCLALAAAPFDSAVAPVRMQTVNPKSPLKACKRTGLSAIRNPPRRVVAQ